MSAPVTRCKYCAVPVLESLSTRGYKMTQTTLSMIVQNEVKSSAGLEFVSINIMVISSEMY